MNSSSHGLTEEKFFESGAFRLYYYNGVYMGDVLMDDDGYYKWWPDFTNKGFLDEGCLLAVASYLHDKNKDWDEQVKFECS